jgi:hypothetical protein
MHSTTTATTGAAITTIRSGGSIIPRALDTPATGATGVGCAIAAAER